MNVARSSSLGHHIDQHGISLVVVLLILLVVSAVGIGAARISLQGERSARFDRDYQVAFQSAEAALMDAESEIVNPASTRAGVFEQGNALDFPPGCATGATTRGLCSASSETRPIWFEVDFMNMGANAPSAAIGEFTGRAFDAAGSGVAGVRPAHRPRYIIEAPDAKLTEVSAKTDAAASPGPGGKVYRVTAIGFGPREDVQVVLQMSFQK